jgi:hypothetical protein
MYKIPGKCQFQGKATWVSVVAGYRNTKYVYQNTVKYVANMHILAGGGTLFNLL